MPSVVRQIVCEIRTRKEGKAQLLVFLFSESLSQTSLEELNNRL